MIKIIALIFSLFLYAHTNYAQHYTASLSTGYNRVGVFLQPEFKVGFNAHHLNFGLKVYGYNLFFAKNVVGPQLGYEIHIKSKNEKFEFYPGFSVAIFNEKRIANSLILTELNLSNSLLYFLKPNVGLHSSIGIGYILTHANTFNTNETTNSAYPSYQISLGILYRFGAAE
ncbi:hypothetical protein DNU06_11310 [Putridiphycobacter roseus]|uniref:Outer membrane protein beta-barrel domain-containing protein n=1 Tax=Putridiphycobacter roseus TaxID=2219161 RepID=A0A2W1MYB4_9FLAO|nr:hypothetical protein [Putridiphycobacter roseus]PZE16837.1 hypothetical protein DNU06_11310 [Putridiphycobacter roseus]